MRKLFTILAAAGLAAFGVSAANAGTLSGGTLVVNSLGNQGNFSTTAGASGTSTATTATLAAGSAFKGTTTFTGVPVVSTVHIFIRNNGKLSATTGGAVNVTAGATGSAVAGKLSAPILKVPLNAGVAGTQTVTGFGGLLKVVVKGSAFHLGPIATTGAFTSQGKPQGTGTVTTGGLIRVATTGSINLTANGGGTVKLVTLTHVIVSGLSSGNSVAPTILTLTYVPEPGTLLLLGAGIAGLAATGRKKRA
jgi:hypothetical protein